MRAVCAVCAVLLAFVAPSPAMAEAGEPMSIRVAHGDDAENRTKAQLERLLATYDVSGWVFTREVMIDRTELPHSHPVLTLHTRHLSDDELLLSTFLHEQLHWYLAERREQTEAAMAMLRERFPDLPVGYPQGSSDEAGNYVHLLIGLLEWNALREAVGELRARQVMEFWADDHYTAIYRVVLDQPGVIAQALRANELMLPNRGR